MEAITLSSHDRVTRSHVPFLINALYSSSIAFLHPKDANASLTDFGGATLHAATTRTYLGLGLKIPIWDLVTHEMTFAEGFGESSLDECGAIVYSDIVRSSIESTPNSTHDGGDTILDESSRVIP